VSFTPRGHVRLAGALPPATKKEYLDWAQMQLDDLGGTGGKVLSRFINKKITPSLVPQIEDYALKLLVALRPEVVSFMQVQCVDNLRSLVALRAVARARK
jgi:hypothetical protein